MNSRDKGKRGERELAAILKEYGYCEARRGQQYCGADGSADRKSTRLNSSHRG